MTLEEEFKHVAQYYFKDENLENFRLEILAGDASTRRYVRVHYKEKSSLLCLNNAQNVKHNQDFIYWTAKYLEHGIRVPEILYFEPGYILQEDFGDQTLLKSLANESDEKKRTRYNELIRMLLKVHDIPPNEKKDIGQFDEKKLFFEIDMTLDNFIKSMCKASDESLNEIRSLFEPIVKKIISQKYVVSHRDFHSRNIMIDETSNPCIIDYQDTMLGARQYDLCSLVDDCYVDLSEDLKVKLIGDYYSEANLACSEDEFREIYDYSMIQRTFKAIGSFSYHAVKNDNLNYVGYINSSMKSILKVLDRHSELENLKNSLYSYRYEG